MRAQRLLALLMLLKVGERMTAPQLAAELGVSERTVLRDIDSLSVSGIPVYAERGRNGGFALLPGYRTDLTGLTAEEATSLLAGAGRLESPAFAAALRKLAAAMPDAHRVQAARAAQRILVRPEGFVRAAPDNEALGPVQHAVFAGLRIKVDYRRRDQAEPVARVLDPIGLIVAGDVWYLIAGSGERERMYRLSRMSAVEVLDEPAQRAEQVDLESIWQQRRAEFRGRFQALAVTVECRDTELEAFSGFGEVMDVGEATYVDDDAANGSPRIRVELNFRDANAGKGKLWMLMLERNFVVVEPHWLRDEMSQRLQELNSRNTGR